VFVGELNAINGVNGSNDTGIWLGDDNSLTLVAREGSPALGDMSTDVVFGGFESNTSQGINFITVNSAGRVAFAGGLTGEGVTPDSNYGILAQDSDGELHLIARKGDVVEVAPGDFRTISSLAFAGGVGDDDGYSSGFNDIGQVAFQAAFMDGSSHSSAIFVSNLVASLPDDDGDFNHDGIVDAADYAVWRKKLAEVYTPDHYYLWRANFGETVGGAGGTATTVPVPEPVSIFLVALAAIVVIAGMGRKIRFVGAVPTLRRV
jgi:hypothetical protein